MAHAHFEPSWALIQRPGGYPVRPAVGKPEYIWRTNAKSLYHRLSPYASSTQGLLSWGTEPYYYVYPDEGDSGLPKMRKYESRMFPIGSAPIDVIRVSKFLVSGRGVGFLAKQFLLQTAQPYNETRIYNPTSPIVAAGLTLALGTVRPMRMFDTSGGLTGIASTLLGSAGSTIFGAPKTNPVPGTTFASNSDALPTATKTTGTKGLLRAGDAIRAKSHLEAAWQGKSTKKFSLKAWATSVFQNFIPQTQDGIKYRSDEKAYGLMIGAGQAYFKYKTRRGGTLDFHQLFIGGGDITRPEGDYPSEASRLFVNPDGTPKVVKVLKLPSVGSIPGSGAVGYSVDESRDSNSPGYRYGDAVGVQKSKDYEASDVMIQYKYYQESGKDFPTKNPDKTKPDIQKINETLKNTIRAIRDASEGTYKFDDAEPGIVRAGKFTYDYNRLIASKEQTHGKPGVKPQPLSALSIYRNTGVRMVSNDLANGSDKSLKLPTNGKFDAINTLTVLDPNEEFGLAYKSLPGQPNWNAYEDDLIALYFYDVVNDKYIPFRAAIKGIAEAGNASWEEMPFIGRADKAYSYGGFNRNLSFTIHVVIGSVAELAPTWQRINYIMTAYKPANYTKASKVSSGNGAYDRFLVPPMFMLTIGDMYRDQPILIQSITATVPEDAAWETCNEENVGAGNWEYMAKLISSPSAKFGQVPREIELGFTVALLEKERAVVGGANFGHAPRGEEFQKWNTDTVPDGKDPNDWSKNYVVDVIKSAGTAPSVSRGRTGIPG